MKIYEVGGAVRDAMLDKKAKDKDWVVVGSSPEEMISNGFKPIGKDFPVFLHPNQKKNMRSQGLNERLVMAIMVLTSIMVKR